MATFEVRVEGLTGLSIDGSSNPTQDELTEYLKDGVIEITDRIIALKPEEVDKFMRTTTSDSQGVDVGSAKVISVMREANADGSSDGSTSWRDCKKVSSSLQSRLVDSTSLHFSSIYNPAYIRENNSLINVYPVPSSNNGIKVFYVNEEPRDITNNASLVYSHANIKYFPNDKVYLVVLYAGIKSLENALARKNTVLETSLLPDEIVLESITSSLPTYTSPSDLVLPVSPIAPTMSTNTITLPTTQPSYTQPVFSVPTTPTFDNLVLPVPPSAPSDPSFSTLTLDTVTASIIASPPTFTAPQVGGASEELTASMTALNSDVIGTDADFLDFSDWFTAAGEYIEDEEDLDLASAQLQKIQTYVQAYSAQMQSNQADFNAEAAEYQAQVQIGLKNADLEVSRAIQEKNYVQQQEIQEYTNTLAKYQNDIGKYSAEVNTAIQQWLQEEYTAKYSVWIAEFNSGVQKYGADIQNALNNFNKENTVYQAEVQESLQEAQLAESKEGRDIQIYNGQLQNYTADITKETGRFTAELGEISKEFESNLQKYTAEMQNVSSINQNKIADYSAKVQKSQIRLQQYQMDYGWMEARLAKIQAEYDSAFSIIGAKLREQQQQQQQVRR